MLQSLHRGSKRPAIAEPRTPGFAAPLHELVLLEELQPSHIVDGLLTASIRSRPAWRKKLVRLGSPSRASATSMAGQAHERQSEHGCHLLWPARTLANT